MDALEEFKAGIQEGLCPSLKAEFYLNEYTLQFRVGIEVYSVRAESDLAIAAYSDPKGMGEWHADRLNNDIIFELENVLERLKKERAIPYPDLY